MGVTAVFTAVARARGVERQAAAAVAERLLRVVMLASANLWDDDFVVASRADASAVEPAHLARVL